MEIGLNTDPPIWGWYTETSIVNKDATFICTFQPAMLSVWVNGIKTLSYQDWTATGLTDEQVPRYIFQFSDHYRAIHGMPLSVILTYLVITQSADPTWKYPERTTRTDTRDDGRRATNIRGID